MDIMFGRRQKQKYEIVNNTTDDVEVEYEPTKRKVLTPACLWSSLTTSVLISIYFAPSIGLTFYQRWLLKNFKFPILTVFVHMVVKYLLAILVRSIIALKQGRQKLVVGWKEYFVSLAPTGLFSAVDICFSNWGLALINVSLYSMTKSTTIIFILLFAVVFKLEKKSWSLLLIVLMISTGVTLFTYKATQFNTLGFTLVMIASMSSGLRWTCIQLLMQRSKMGMHNPIEMIYHMQPFMIIPLLPFVLAIEGGSFIDFLYSTNKVDIETRNLLVAKILIGAFIAFFMEVSEVMVIGYTSSLTLTVAGIFKEIIILTIAVVFQGDVISELNCVGLVICLGGIICHVVYKIRTTQNFAVAKSFHFESSDHLGDFGLEKSLIGDEVTQLSVSSESEGYFSQFLPRLQSFPFPKLFKTRRKPVKKVIL